MLMKGNTHNNLAITIDIEDWYHIPSVCGSPFSVYKNTDDFFATWNERYDYLTEPTTRVVNLLRESDIKATFFIVADVVKRYPGLVESVADEGHEIACHGLDHSCKIDPTTKKPLFSPDDFKIRTLQARQILEKASGRKIIGYRAPNALVGGWMLDVLETIGFTYDSSVSVNSVYNKSDSGLGGVTSAPYYPQTGSLKPAPHRNIIEFPWSYYSLGGFKLPTSGGPMLRFLGADMILKGLKQSLGRGNTVFYFHPIDISHESFPRIGKGRPFYWMLKGDLIEKRIKYILKNLKGIEKICLKDALKDLP
jgi:peptidoglycan/xylan/chitin deacetylase (PgdA/CDA1 family)